MKRITGIMILLFGLTQVNHSQTVNVSFQPYLDANANCNYNPGEILLYNTTSTYSLSYISSSGSLTTVVWYEVTCPGAPRAITNFSLPATNTLILLPPFNIQPSSSCSSYTNIPFTSTNTIYLPYSSANANYVQHFYNGNFLMPGSNSYTVCANIGSDTIALNIYASNFYTCNLTSSKTFSFYLDGTKYDEITTSNTLTTTYTAGVFGMATLTEYYNVGAASFDFRTKLPASISSLTSHTFEIKSSMVFNNPLSVLNYSCILNSVSPSSPLCIINGLHHNAQKTNQFNLIPNPFNDKLSIQSNQEIKAIYVSNAIGQKIKEEHINSNEHTIDLHELPSAMYFITVQWKDNEESIKKVIKQ